MAFLTSHQRNFLQAISQLGYCNPFLPERVTYEQHALGADFVETVPFWSMRVADPDAPYPNTDIITQRAETLIQGLRQRLVDGLTASESDCSLYEDAVLWVLYHHTTAKFYDLIIQSVRSMHNIHPQPNQSPPPHQRNQQRLHFYT